MPRLQFWQLKFIVAAFCYLDCAEFDSAIIFSKTDGFVHFSARETGTQLSTLYSIEYSGRLDTRPWPPMPITFAVPKIFDTHFIGMCFRTSAFMCI